VPPLRCALIYNPYSYICFWEKPGMQVAKWGNSLAVRLPAALVAALELRAGDDIEITLDAPRRFVVQKKPDADALLERLSRFRGKLPPDFRFRREEANAR